MTSEKGSRSRDNGDQSGAELEQFFPPSSLEAAATNCTSTTKHPQHISSTSSSFWPLLFERAAPSWWNPRFDSSILEDQYWKSTLPRTTRRFQFGLSYVLILILLLAGYFATMKTRHWHILLSKQNWGIYFLSLNLYNNIII